MGFIGEDVGCMWEEVGCIGEEVGCVGGGGGGRVVGAGMHGEEVGCIGEEVGCVGGGGGGRVVGAGMHDGGGGGREGVWDEVGRTLGGDGVGNKERKVRDVRKNYRKDRLQERYILRDII